LFHIVLIDIVTEKNKTTDIDLFSAIRFIKHFSNNPLFLHLQSNNGKRYIEAPAVKLLPHYSLYKISVMNC